MSTAAPHTGERVGFYLALGPLCRDLEKNGVRAPAIGRPSSVVVVASNVVKQFDVDFCRGHAKRSWSATAAKSLGRFLLTDSSIEAPRLD